MIYSDFPAMWKTVKGDTMHRKKVIYFIFTDTGTYLSKMINFFTKKSLNHVSLGFDSDLTEVYSFGRINPHNPFSGGFVKENIRGNFLKHSTSAIYVFQLTDDEWERLLQYIRMIEMEKDNYKYNFIGLLGILLNIQINRKNAYFCSQFVATAMRETQSFQFTKPPCFTTPADIRAHKGLKLIYEGRLGNYKNEHVPVVHTLLTKEEVQRTSLLWAIGKMVKQFVIR